MSIKTIVLWVIVAFFLTTVIGVGCTYMNVQAQWARLDNSTDAVFDRQRATHDEMWKVVKSQMGLKDEQKEMYLAALTAYQERGKATSNASWVWLQESFPQLNQTGAPAFYQQLANTIADQNGKLTSIRNDVITVTQSYNDFVTNPYNQFFLSADQEKKRESRIITSGVTNEAARTGEDNLEWMNK